MRFHDPARKSQFGAVYAVSARTELCGVNAAVSAMRAAGSRFMWRIAYKSGVVTCRAALHVLHKRDAARNRFILSALEPRYASWKRGDLPASPFHVLEAERNALLKEGLSTFPEEIPSDENVEPRLLSGGRFLLGSDLVEGFAAWILEEIEVIEDAAQMARRIARGNKRP